MGKPIKIMKQLLDYCEVNDVKLTPLREDVLKVICSSEQPLTAYQILRQIREVRSNAEPPTIYRVLEFLEQEHLIHRIATTNAYMVCVHPEVSHANQILLCNSCGDAVEIHDRKLSQVIKRSAETHGFCLGNELTEIRGVCESCQSR